MVGDALWLPESLEHTSSSSDNTRPSVPPQSSYSSISHSMQAGSSHPQHPQNFPPPQTSLQPAVPPQLPPTSHPQACPSSIANLARQRTADNQASNQSMLDQTDNSSHQASVSSQPNRLQTSALSQQQAIVPLPSGRDYVTSDLSSDLNSQSPHSGPIHTQLSLLREDGGDNASVTSEQRRQREDGLECSGDYNDTMV